MASAGSNTGGLPSGFIAISDIVIHARVPLGSMASVIGFVTDYQQPMATSGKDHKCTLTLCDLSSNDSSEGVVFNIFRPPSAMPKVSFADVVVVHLAKVQRYKASSTCSLITSNPTKIRVYSASKIPRPPNSAAPALVPEGDQFEPSKEVHHYVPRLYHHANKDNIMPSEAEFQQRVVASMNVKQKFCLLSDVHDGRFCDLVVQVCREPFDLGDKVTLYVSDYTENPAFFNYSLDSINDLVSRPADPYGYTVATNSAAKENDKLGWVGPLGKRAIQITAFEPHASFVREYVAAGEWVTLRNVQIKYGHDHQNLEGKLRGDQDFPTKLNVSVVNTDGDTVDPRCKEAARRCKNYHAEKDVQLKQLKAAETAGGKRKAAVSVNKTDESFSKHLGEGEAKSKQAEKRARKKLKNRQATNPRGNNNSNNEGHLSAQTPQIEAQLNPHVRCAQNSSVPISSIATILAPSYHLTTINNEEVNLPLPFINAKYRSHVRVVDFHPPTVEQFAVAHNPSPYDGILSDSESSSDESAPGPNAVWEWRFSLQLEDASPSSLPPERVWVVVNNAEGQMLTGLNATDLRSDIETLSALHDLMAVLWGNLEECKTKAAAKREKGRARGGLQRPPESSDVEDEEPLTGMPFPCCIVQYGVPIQGSAEAGAKPAREWTRVFALAGTMIKH